MIIIKENLAKMLYSKIETYNRLNNINESKPVNEFLGMGSLFMSMLFMKMFEKLFPEEKSKDEKSKDEKPTGQPHGEPSTSDLLANVAQANESGKGLNESEMFLRSCMNENGEMLSDEEAAERFKENFKKEDGSFDEESFNQYRDKQKEAYDKAKNDGTLEKAQNAVKNMSEEDRENALEDAKKKAMAIHQADKIKEAGDKKNEEIEAERQAKITEAVEQQGGPLADEKRTLQNRRDANTKEREAIEKEKEQMTQMLSKSGDEAKEIAKNTRDAKISTLDEKLTDNAISGRVAAKKKENEANAQKAYDDAVAEPNKKIEELQGKIDGDDGLQSKFNKAKSEYDTLMDLKENNRAEYERKIADEPGLESRLKNEKDTAETNLTSAQEEINTQKRAITTADSNKRAAMENAETKAKQDVEEENKQIKKDKQAAEDEYNENIRDIDSGDRTTDPEKIREKVNEKFKEREDKCKTEENSIKESEISFMQKAKNDPNLSSKISDIDKTYDEKIADNNKEVKEKFEKMRTDAGLNAQPDGSMDKTQKPAEPKEPEAKTPKEPEAKTQGGDSDEEMKEKYKQILKDAGKSDDEIEKAMSDIGDEKGEDLEAAIDAHAEENNIDIDDLDSAEEEEGDEEEDDGKGGKSKTKFRKVKKKVGKGVKIQRWSPKSNEWVSATKEEYQEWKSRQGKKNESLKSFISRLLYS